MDGCLYSEMDGHYYGGTGRQVFRGTNKHVGRETHRPNNKGGGQTFANIRVRHTRKTISVLMQFSVVFDAIDKSND